MTHADLMRRLMVERFGPPRVLARERWLPVPAHRDGACDNGPSVVQMAIETPGVQLAPEGAAA